MAVEKLKSEFKLKKSFNERLNQEYEDITQFIESKKFENQNIIKKY